jgi:predicted HTH transcriptional regulator
MKTVCAFLNSEGGTLLIGVADTGVPKGLADDLKHFVDHQNVDGFELRLRQALSRNISPDPNQLVAVSFPYVSELRQACEYVHDHWR